MPQDELWAASARLTGYHIRYQLDVQDDELDVLTVAPTWSKHPPRERDGAVVATVPTFMRWSMPAVFTIVHGELLGGVARNLPGVVRRELRQIQHGFEQGELH